MDDAPPPSVCELCSQVCPTLADLTEHLARTHGVNCTEEHKAELHRHRNLVDAVCRLEAETTRFLHRSRQARDPREKYEAQTAHRDAAMRVWTIAGEGLRARNTPNAYLRQVIWRVGNAEQYADRRSTNVPHPLARPAAVLMAEKIDVAPEEAFVTTRGRPRLTELILQIEESRLSR